MFLVTILSDTKVMPIDIFFILHACSIQHRLSTGKKVTSRLSDYLSCEGDYRENDGESLS